MNEAIAYNIGIAGMHCGGCVARVEKAIAGVSGVSSVHVNLATEGARIEVDRRSSMADVLAALSAAGYGPAVERFSLKIDGLGCGACVARVEKALNRYDAFLKIVTKISEEPLLHEQVFDLGRNDRLLWSLLKCSIAWHDAKNAVHRSDYVNKRVVKIA